MRWEHVENEEPELVRDVCIMHSYAVLECLGERIPMTSLYSIPAVCMYPCPQRDTQVSTILHFRHPNPDAPTKYLNKTPPSPSPFERSSAP